MNHDLFDDLAPDRATEHLMDGALVIRQFALPNAESLMEGIEKVTSEAPFRHMKTPGGHSMSAAMSCCGISPKIPNPASHGLPCRLFFENWP